MLSFYIIKNYISLSEKLYPVFAKLFSSTEKKGGVIVTKDTDIVIEGYPRCGNSFAEIGFRVANMKKNPNLNIAHHCHAAAQIKNAARLNLPCLVVLRDPLEACISNCIFSKNKITPKESLIAYYLFYESLLPYNKKFVLGLFEDVTVNFHLVIKSLNNHFKTNFDCPKHDDDFNLKTFKLLKEISLERQKNEYKDKYLSAAEDYSSPNSKNSYLNRDKQKEEIKNLFYEDINKKYVLRAYRIYNIYKKNLTTNLTD